jgi:hypothetical protein
MRGAVDGRALWAAAKSRGRGAVPGGRDSPDERRRGTGAVRRRTGALAAGAWADQDGTLQE